MNELLKGLRPVKNRIRLRRMIQGLAAGFAAGAAAALILMAVSVFVPIGNRWLLCGGIVLAGVLAGALGNGLRPVANREAAKTADGCGLRERTVTALEMAEKTPGSGAAAEILEAQRQDACAHLKTLDTKKIRVKTPGRILAGGMALLVACAGLSLIPGNGEKTAAARRELQEKTAPMVKAIDEAEAEEEKGKSEAEKAELRKITDDLKRDLEDSRDPVDALVALDKAEQRLEELRDKTAGDAAKELADAMRDAGMDAAADALENGDAQSLASAALELDADALRDAAKDLSGEAQELAEQLAQAAEQGEMSEAQMQAISNAMQGQNGQSGASASALQQALDGMKASLGGESKQQGNGEGGSSPGNGPGEGQGQNGGGAGEGSTNEEQQGGGSGQQGGAGKNSRDPRYKEGEYETIYDPEKVEAATRDVSTEQNKLGDDSVQIETGPGKGKLDGNVPYREVVGEYAQAEAQAAESEHLTTEQKEWVDEYFRRITEE